MKKPACLLYDPTPFAGGSKIATQHMMAQTKAKVIYHILSADLASWQIYKKNMSIDNDHIFLHKIYSPAWLQKQSQGLLYWFKQLIFTLNLFFCFALIFFTRQRLPNKILVFANPSVDIAGYFFIFLFKFFCDVTLVQFIHGGGFHSAAVAWCLKQKHATFYLQSMEKKLKTELGLFENEVLPKHYQPFVNGIPKSNWPSSRIKDRPAQLLWAASLLKWKGLDIFVQAHQLGKLGEKAITQICYIKPQNINLEQSLLPSSMLNTFCVENPANLDAIRANSSIFISTSENEPFGLSILEALATGLLVVIPKDGAYWDNTLTDKKNCLKYTAKDPKSLAKVLLYALSDIEQVAIIANNGLQMAENYHAERTYLAIANSIERNTALQEVVA